MYDYNTNLLRWYLWLSSSRLREELINENTSKLAVFKLAIDIAFHAHVIWAIILTS